MTQFWIAALALGLVAAAIVLVPMWRAWAKETADRSSAALGVGIVVALAVPVLATMLYARWTTWDWSSGGLPALAEADAMHEMDEAITALERRIAQEPDNIEGWMLLGRSYMSLQRFGDAAQAFRQAVALDETHSVQLLADFGEALALSEPEGLQGEAGAIFERVLTTSPAHPKGLWYGGLNAYENANWALADQRLSLLLTLNPPETLIPLIEERIADARAHTGDTPAPAETVADQPATPPQARPGNPGADATATQEAGDGISIEVSLDPALAARIPGPTPMFIIARGAEGGPPLAVIRANTTELPVSVMLTDANAMMAGVRITDQAELELVARVSLSGSPAQRPGDLYGAVSYARGRDGPTRITIDRIAE